MLKLAQVGSVLCLVSLVLAFNGKVADAGLSTNCVTADGSNPSLLVQIKKKKHKDGNEHDASELTECTIQGAGGGGGCKTGFKRVCEKLNSGKKCCGCVADKNQGTTAGQSAPEGSGGKTSSGGIKPVDEVPPATLLLPYFECDLSKGPCNTNPQQ